MWEDEEGCVNGNGRVIATFALRMFAASNAKAPGLSAPCSSGRSQEMENNCSPDRRNAY